ncbi:hypothetical protein B0O80DRAFT_502221 [Mortierella sp. GBAus27b]|nr:hypothetical protein B0O80DRAFT_502221 [Mortierella sp. GBAus27b]
MAITNPLILPEIRESLAPFLSIDGLARCGAVCKAWYSSFHPHLWHSIVVHGQKPSRESLQKNRDYVKHLTLQGRTSQDSDPVHYPALESLQILRMEYSRFGAYAMIPQHPTLTHLKLHSEMSSYQLSSDILPTGLSNLTSLNLTGISLKVTGSFWTILMRLETLELRNTGLQHFSTPPEGDWKIKGLTLWLRYGPSAMEQLHWISLCPKLTRLDWRVIANLEIFPVEPFIQFLQVWPELEHICLPESRASDRQLSLIILGTRRLVSLSTTRSELDTLSRAALRPHFPWLKHLDMSYNAMDTSQFTVEVLKSCPQLETLTADSISAEYFLDATPWACEKSLRTLEVCFEFTSRDATEQQDSLLRLLSRLSNLERLDLSNEGSLETVFSLDLRLDRGLVQLATLRRLEKLNICRTAQRMALEDIEWIITHWGSLKTLEGILNTDDRAESEKLSSKLCHAGIDVPQWSRY